MRSMPKQTYHQLQAELAAILDRLQSEDIDIDTAVADYEQGLKVIAELERYLKHAENKVIKLNDTTANHANNE